MDLVTSRPRVLGWVRGAAILDGDWGTSIAYVLGIAFALGGTSSTFHLLMMLGLTTIVALNYITICRLYPDGGGVYSSLRTRARTMAVIISTITLASLAVLAFFAFPIVLPNMRITQAEGGVFGNWHIFVGTVLSISGIESISNMTSVMKDPARNSRRAILSVLVKITSLTLILGFAMNALPEAMMKDHIEYMLRFPGEHYVLAMASLYAIGVVGAILINIFSTGINRSLQIPGGIRIMMIASAAVLFLVEITIAVHELSESLLRRVCEETQLQKSFLYVLNLRQLSVSGDLPESVAGDARGGQIDSWNDEEKPDGTGVEGRRRQDSVRTPSRRNSAGDLQELREMGNYCGPFPKCESVWERALMPWRGP